MSDLRQLNGAAGAGNPLWDLLNAIGNGNLEQAFSQSPASDRHQHGPAPANINEPTVATQTSAEEKDTPMSSAPSHGERGPDEGHDPFDGHGPGFGRDGPPGHHHPHHGGPPPGPHRGHHHGDGPHRGGRHGPGSRGGYGGFGHFGGGRCGGRGFGRGSYGSPWSTGGFDMSRLAEFVQQFIPQASDSRGPNTAFNPFSAARDNDSSSAGLKDFSPPADIFSTPTAYVIHVSLPGAKKEDVGINYDADTSELSIAGVTYRPGDEEFLKTLALDERPVGVFERKIVLGTRTAPALVDAEGITAKMEDGVLIVEVPKLEEGGGVNVRKVDIE